MIGAFALGVAVGATGLLFAIVELLGRAPRRKRHRRSLWPRHDGSDQGIGTVWDHGA